MEFQIESCYRLHVCVSLLPFLPLPSPHPHTHQIHGRHVGDLQKHGKHQINKHKSMCRWMATCWWGSTFSCSWLSSSRCPATCWLSNSLSWPLTGWPVGHCGHPSIQPKSHLSTLREAFRIPQSFHIGNFSFRNIYDTKYKRATVVLFCSLLHT